MLEPTADWLIFDCPACHRTVKMSGAMRGHAVACPFCHGTIQPHQVPASRSPAAPPRPAAAPSPAAGSLPRSVPPAPNLRGSKASWELNRPGTGAPPPSSAPARAASETPAPPSRPAPIASENPQLHRKLIRRENHDHGADSTAASEDSAASKAIKRPSRRHRRKKRMRVLMALVTFLITAAAATLWLLPSREPAPQAAAAPSVDTSLPKLPPAVAGSTITEADYQKIIATVDKFAAATSLETLQEVVRDSDRVRPLINQWLSRQAGEPLGYTAISPRSEIVKYGDMYHGYLEKRGTERRIFAVEPGASRWFFDLECYAGWCELPWESLAETRPTAPTLMRALIQPGNYYAGQFGDRDTLACFHLQSLDRKHSVYAYVERATPLFSELQSRARSASHFPAIVKIRFPVSASAGDQAVLSEWVALGWSLPQTAPAAAK